ncbi:type III pantothenate kinase [Rhodanobacter sp. AS-Z3]|uniref:type III pantothenate kinase n=1 Tax=Rhodanobacter sp. AS-Z3 TaxID=3031330 RepID=UPI002479A98C|nr:type III pantothenate kinase [Rhodanobacter sp. AS-Z3]WEN15010.1 type III pantothenate kinase [Rhodanobacter sp. AS-Z3]
MRLLLDLGNTRLKWAWQTASDGWLKQGALDWRENLEPALEAGWAELPRPLQVIAASVVDATREGQVTALALRLFGLPVIWMRTPAQACGVRNAYAEPQRLGVDRFLVMVAARAASHLPCVLVGVGTALTLDALAADGQHLGGLIAPGPQLMQQSLFDATARISPLDSGQVVELADNTADAVASGCWQAAAALVDRFASRMTVRLGTVPEVVLGGGDAASLLPLLSQPGRLSHDAVLRGLAIWADTQ